MAETTGIQWTNATWNPWHGCRKVSPGCKNCYMFREKKQYGQEPTLVVKSKTKFRDPLKWKEPALVFTCSWSDWFIEEADAWRDEAWDIIRKTPHLTYQILTKRIELAANHLPHDWPLKNVWMGVSVEDQQRADERIPLLLALPATVRFLSVEPLLGPIDLERGGFALHRPVTSPTGKRSPGLDWVIIGGESGPHSRSMEIRWAQEIVEQCRAAGVPVFMKQLGAKPLLNGASYPVTNNHGSDIRSFPAFIATREFPHGYGDQLILGAKV